MSEHTVAVGEWPRLQYRPRATADWFAPDRPIARRARAVGAKFCARPRDFLGREIYGARAIFAPDGRNISRARATVARDFRIYIDNNIVYIYAFTVDFYHSRIYLQFLFKI